MSDRSISRRQISIVAAFDDISEVIPHLMSTGTNSYPALLQIDDNLGQYFLVNSSRSSSSPPNGELKNTRAVLRCCLRLAFWKILWIILESVHIYVSNNWAIPQALISQELSGLRDCRPCLKRRIDGTICFPLSFSSDTSSAMVKFCHVNVSR